MRTTVDIPDELFRIAKTKAAFEGRKLKDLIAEGLRLVLAKPGDAETPKETAVKPKVSVHDLLKEWCGMYDEGPTDLSTNKKYFDDFGR